MMMFLLLGSTNTVLAGTLWIAARISSVEELQQASGVGQGILDRLRQVGALGDLPESSQVSFF